MQPSPPGSGTRSPRLHRKSFPHALTNAPRFHPARARVPILRIAAVCPPRMVETPRPDRESAHLLQVPAESRPSRGHNGRHGACARSKNLLCQTSYGIAGGRQDGRPEPRSAALPGLRRMDRLGAAGLLAAEIADEDVLEAHPALAAGMQLQRDHPLFGSW